MSGSGAIACRRCRPDGKADEGLALRRSSAVMRGRGRPEGVVAEVGFRVTPSRMSMVRLALGVVVLDEQPRALQAVVMRLAQVGGAGPGQVDGVQRVVVVVVCLGRQ